MNKILSLLIITIILTGCKKNNEDPQIDEICSCYTDQTSNELDKTLKSCLNDINAKKEKPLSEEKILTITKELIQSCPKYQNDFNQMLLSRYERRRDVLNLKDIDSIEKLIENDINAAVNQSKLAEYKILEGDLDKAFILVNKSIENNKNIEIGYWIRGFLYHQKGDFKNAIADCNKLNQLTKQENMKIASELWKLNLKEELNQN